MVFCCVVTPVKTTNVYQLNALIIIDIGIVTAYSNTLGQVKSAAAYHVCGVRRIVEGYTCVPSSNCDLRHSSWRIGPSVAHSRAKSATARTISAHSSLIMKLRRSFCLGRQPVYRDWS